MVYAPSQDHGKQVRIEDVPEAQRSRFSLTDEEVQALAQQAILIENITAARWISSGRKTAIPASC